MRRSALALLSLLCSGQAWAGDVKVLNRDAAFPEGPFWADGKLYYAEYGGNRVSAAALGASTHPPSARPLPTILLLK